MALDNLEGESAAGSVELKRVRKQLERESAYVRLLRIVTTAANEANTIEGPLKIAIDAICALTQWPVGHVYFKAEDRDELIPSPLWHLDDFERYAAFKEITQKTRLLPGQGLPGRVFETGSPQWIPDVTIDTNFPRAAVAKDLGVRAAFGLPVLVGREVAAVLEFFSPERAQPDLAFLEVMDQVGTQLGRVIERKRAEEALLNLARGISAKTGDAFFQSLAVHLVKTLKADYSFIGELLPGNAHVRSVAACHRGEIIPNFEYSLVGTPCEHVVSRENCSYPEGVQARFPDDKMLADMGIESYVGTPLADSSGKVMGLQCVLWKRPPANMPTAESMVQIFAVRASNELERRRAEGAIQKLSAVPRVNPHPVLEFSGDGTLKYCNAAAQRLARSMGKDNVADILPADTTGIVRKCLSTGKNGLILDTMCGERTVSWSFIPIVANGVVFAEAFELTLFLELQEELKKDREKSATRRTSPVAVKRSKKSRSAKEQVH